MSDSVSRRDCLKALGVAGASALFPAERSSARASGMAASSQTPAPGAPATATAEAPGTLVELWSTSEVFTPPRGESRMKFSFDFPEPSVAFGGYRFGFLVFTAENVYGLDLSKMTTTGDAEALSLTCDGFVWAGGQQTAPGKLTASLRRQEQGPPGGARAPTIEWDAVVEMDQPIKSVTTIVRGVPRGRVSFGGGAFNDPADNELLAGYPFGGGDLNGPGTSMVTPLLMIQTPSDVLYLASLDERVRPKRFYLAPGDTTYRVEAVYEHDAWREDQRIAVPAWRLGRAATADGAASLHLRHLEQSFGLTEWESRRDVPAWMRDVALVATLHGMHYTGYMFNDFQGMLEILRWIATQIPGHRVLVFVPAWDGRYYWDYPTYEVSERMGGEAAFRRLVDEAHRLGFKIMPMFGANAANSRLPSWSKLAGAVTRKIDGNAYNLDWVDWNNDRHQDGWLGYMNLGADVWREHLEGRIAEIIDRFGVDAYFLDIVGGHVNSTNGDMHEGTRRLVEALRAKYPAVACVGEMPYDALHGFIPMFQVGLGDRWSKYSRAFRHLSSPAPGRGSSGVHESGFATFDPETLSLSPTSIPTLQVVDDTFARHREVMAAVIARAKQRAGIA